MSFNGVFKLKPKLKHDPLSFNSQLDKAETEEERDRILDAWAEQINKQHTDYH